VTVHPSAAVVRNAGPAVRPSGEVSARCATAQPNATYRWEHNEQGALLVTIDELDPGEEHPGYHEVLTSRPWLRVGDVD
jgi:hypothetical protein